IRGTVLEDNKVELLRLGMARFGNWPVHHATASMATANSEPQKTGFWILNQKSLPTADQLSRLPLRALVAYAARNARRRSYELRGIVADQVLDDVLKLIELVSTADSISELDKPSVIRAAERVAAAYANLPDSL